MSGIYIPGMGLPEDEQLIVITIDGIAMLVGPEVTKLRAEQVVPVPDHGDLIDRGLLCKALRSMAENEYTPEVFANWIEYHIDTIIPADKEERND